MTDVLDDGLQDCVDGPWSLAIRYRWRWLGASMEVLSVSVGEQDVERDCDCISDVVIILRSSDKMFFAIE